MEQHAVIQSEEAQTGLVVSKVDENTSDYTFSDGENDFFARMHIFVSGYGYQECAVYIHAYNQDCTWNVSGDDEFQRCWFGDSAIAEQHIRATFARIITPKTEAL